MDYEKNKETLAIVRQMISDGQVSQEVAEKYFPELAESEDEKIRKAIIDYIKTGTYHKSWIDWLERQGEKTTKQTNEKAWLYLVADILTLDNGIGQYLDDPKVQELAKKLSKEYSDRLCFTPCEQTPVEYANGDDYGIDGLWHAINILEKTLGKVEGYQTDDGVLEHECAITAVAAAKADQKPVEWSKEDEEMIENIDCWLNEYRNIIIVRDGNKAAMIHDGHNWLKSIRQKLSNMERNGKNWKPTEEQIEALDFIIDCTIYPDLQDKRKVLKDLLEQLKAL